MLRNRKIVHKVRFRMERRIRKRKHWKIDAGSYTDATVEIGVCDMLQIHCSLYPKCSACV